MCDVVLKGDQYQVEYEVELRLNYEKRGVIPGKGRVTHCTLHQPFWKNCTYYCITCILYTFMIRQNTTVISL